LVPNFETSKEGNVRNYVGWDGVQAQYVSPMADKIKKPQLQGYLEEWEVLKAGKQSK
jgi:lysine 2,3-aminomutase